MIEQLRQDILATAHDWALSGPQTVPGCLWAYMSAIRFNAWLGDNISYSMVLPSSLVTLFQGVAWFGPQLRTSNDHCFIVGVP